MTMIDDDDVGSVPKEDTTGHRLAFGQKWNRESQKSRRRRRTKDLSLLSSFRLQSAQNPQRGGGKRAPNVLLCLLLRPLSRYSFNAL